jgi:hypothetical protein
VSPGQDHLWYVRHIGSPDVHSFPTRQQAEAFAQRWAKRNRPSVVQVQLHKGEISREWMYGADGGEAGA